MRDLQWIIRDEQEAVFRAHWRRRLGRDPDEQLVRAFMSNAPATREFDLRMMEAENEQAKEQ